MLESTLTESDAIGRSLLAKMRAGKTHSEAEVTERFGVSLDAEHANP